VAASIVPSEELRTSGPKRWVFQWFRDLLDWLLCLTRHGVGSGIRGFLFLRAVPGLLLVLPALRRPQAVTASPAAVLTLVAAWVSRSWTVPQSAHVHCRTFRGLDPSLTPRVEEVWEVGSNRPIVTRVRPYAWCLVRQHAGER
jgi:hypothetical protein